MIRLKANQGNVMPIHVQGHCGPVDHKAAQILMRSFKIP